MTKRSLLFLLLLSGSAFASQAPTPSPSPAVHHRPRIADLDHAGTTVGERHPWIGRIEYLLQVGLLFLVGRR